MKLYLDQHWVAVITLLSLLGLISCSSRRYIEELPYLHSSEQYTEELNWVKSRADSAFNTENEHSEKLNDEEMDIMERYSIIMGVMPKKVTNYKLYSFIDQWMGRSANKQTFDQKNGVNCAQFTSLLFNEVYQETLSPIPEKVFRSKDIELFTGRSFLQEGDILFFRYDKLHPISDEGIYLQNNRIVACTAGGLNIYDFNDKYFQLRYIAAGRLKPKS
ncbi:NlpC/P60 family protein [Chryseobacterium rhizoplanae]|uniref:NlpC/P60 family protein n=1 Tax=Chryseobacterium rhizoplanae TaxID=1609531 RepID=A0A521DM60_9FLAO|nr:NlpC/P60 family protein [Chryseobacterium rhizoplanae]SMO72718.1 NlpC/P60 family protein [Chryseobacterium rhizoplanae]